MCVLSHIYVCTDSCLCIYILIPIYMHIIVPVQETCEVVNSHTHYPVHVPVQETCEVVNSRTHYPVPVEESKDCDSVTSCGKYVDHL